MVDNNCKNTDDKCELIVIGSNILIKKIIEQKFGSLLLINNTNEQHFRGVVWGLGTGIQDKHGNNIPFHVKVGDEVFLPKYKGSDIRFGDETYVVIPENELIAVIRVKK